MQKKEQLVKQYKSAFPDWSDVEVEKYATIMSEKYSTIKRGDNVIHLDYYDGLITATEISDIEKSLKEFDLELSRFDKNGVPYASIEDFNLHIAIFLSASIVQNILHGLGSNALWDTIKNITYFVWAKVKQRHWDRPAEKQRKTNLNFGLKVNIDKNKSFELKLDGDLSDELVFDVLEKMLDLLKSAENKDRHQTNNFYIFDKQFKKLTKVDKMNEVSKKLEKQIFERKKTAASNNGL